MNCGLEWQKNGSLKVTMLADVGKTKDGKFYLKKWSLNDGENWIYPCEIEEAIESKDVRGGKGHIPRGMTKSLGELKFVEVSVDEEG